MIIELSGPDTSWYTLHTDTATAAALKGRPTQSTKAPHKHPELAQMHTKCFTVTSALLILWATKLYVAKLPAFKQTWTYNPLYGFLMQVFFGQSLACLQWWKSLTKHFQLILVWLTLMAMSTHHHSLASSLNCASSNFKIYPAYWNWLSDL